MVQTGLVVTLYRTMPGELQYSAHDMELYERLYLGTCLALSLLVFVPACLCARFKYRESMYTQQQLLEMKPFIRK